MNKIIRYLYPIGIRLLTTAIFTLPFETIFKDVPLYSDLDMIIQLALVPLTQFIAIGAVYLWGDRAVFTFKFKWRYFLVGIILFISLRFIHYHVNEFFPRISENQERLNQVYEASPTFFVRGGQLLMTCLFAPVFEEFLYRGAVMTSYFKNSPYYLDVLFSATIFGLIHVIAYPWSTFDFLLYLSAGLTLAILFRYTKSIYYPIAFHILWNTMNNWIEIYHFIYHISYYF